MFPNPIFPPEKFLNLEIHWYGIFIALGLLACFVVLYLYTKHRKMNSKVQDFIYFLTIIAIALGFLFAKLYQAVYDWIDNDFEDFDFMNAGITAMGGFIGGAATFVVGYFAVGNFLFKGKEKGVHIKEFNTVLCVAPLCILIAHAFGRIGCLCAGCCHGTYLGEEYVVGGIYMEGNSGWGYYVPAQLYESLFLFVAFAVLSIMYFKGFNLTMPTYLISYGVWRFCIEFVRADYRGFSIAFSPSQWQSIIFVLSGVGLILFYYFKKIPFWLPKTENKNDELTEKEN